MADSQLPEDKKLCAKRKTNYSEYQLSLAKGDSVEKTVFKVLKEFFSDLNQNVVIEMEQSILREYKIEMGQHEMAVMKSG